MSKLRAFPLFVAGSGCSYHRIHLPFMYAGDYWTHELYEPYSIEKLPECLAKSQLVVWNRHMPDENGIVANLRKQGLKVVVDLDDWIELPWQHPQYRYYQNGGAQAIIDNLKEADAVTVTTERLAAKVRQFNKNVHVIPNALPFGQGQFVPSVKEKAETFDFVYGGGSSHLEDVRMLVNPFRKIREIKGISFTMAGYSDHPIWDKMESVFKPMQDYHRINHLPLDSYMKLYDESHCSLVPLLANHFNAHKSNLKLLEAAAKKIPAIVSKVPPYSDDAEAPVLWVESQSDWYRHIKYLSQNRNAATDLGEKLWEWGVKSFNLEHWNSYRFAIFDTIVKIS